MSHDEGDQGARRGGPERAATSRVVRRDRDRRRGSWTLRGRPAGVAQPSVTPRRANRAALSQGATRFHAAKTGRRELDLAGSYVPLRLAPRLGLDAAASARTWLFDEAHEVLDTFVSLLGTSLSAGRLRARQRLAPCSAPTSPSAASNSPPPPTARRPHELCSTTRTS